MDPLTLVTDISTRPSSGSSPPTTKGHRVQVEDGTGQAVGIPFTAEQVERLTGREPMQPAGAALLQLARQHREALLDGPGDALSA
ncbi:hypothetical protein [Kitasatospora sp. NPDC005856]|uniref:hypothetical protein n=1 Tax=Kitasatospora sp. NPDC005856 TaxID=3154566 RepID=UPI0033DE6C5D